MTVDDDYYNEIIMLYRAGVLSGKDEYGTFSRKKCDARGNGGNAESDY